MGIIINEFEVVTETQSGNQQANAAQTNKQEPQPPASHNIERIIRHQKERLLRVWAH